jgi:hypothetical protein
VNENFGLPASTEAVPGGTKWVDAGARQEQRLAAVPAIYKTTHERLACDLMMGMEEPDKIFEDYGFTSAQSLELTESPAFTALCKRIGSEIRENGLSFKTKMKALAEELIPNVHEMATDPLAPAAVRAKLFEWVGKMAGFEPAPQKGVVDGGGGFNLSITFAGQAPAQIVGTSAHVPTTIEHQP